jgi:hypothetical protein
MGSKIIGTFLVVVVIWLGWLAYDYWTSKEALEGKPKSKAVRTVTLEDLGQLPERLEQELAEAQKEGASGLKRFLTKYQKAPVLKDPRKAWIQLDYVVMVSLTDPGEARRVFREVKNRVGPDSPVYERVKKMQPTYQ